MCQVTGLAMANTPVHPALVESPTAAERHYSPSEVAVLWRFNVETIRRLFQNEAGVMVLQSPVRKWKRPYKTIRIPHSVLERVRARLQR
jgi:hypothetical protein